METIVVFVGSRTTMVHWSAMPARRVPLLAKLAEAATVTRARSHEYPAEILTGSPSPPADPTSPGSVSVNVTVLESVPVLPRPSVTVVLSPHVPVGVCGTL